MSALPNNRAPRSTLTGPFDSPPDPAGIVPTSATMELVRGQVDALLSATPSYHSLASGDQEQLAGRLTRISGYAAECLRDIYWQSKELGQVPVVRQRRELAAPVARAQGNDFNAQAAGQIARVTEQTLKAIAFPTFVADLIRGTFDAIVKTSILQMEAFIEMVGNVTKTVDQFMQDNVSDEQARGWLASRYPGHIRMEGKAAVAAEGADELPPPEFDRDLHLSGAPSLDESSIEEILVPAARRKLAESRLQMLSTLVLMGINRIVVTGGKIRATMGFHIDTSDRARQESANDFNFRTAASGGVNMGFWNVSASLSLSYVSSNRASSDQEINVESDLTGEVELHFKSDYFPVQRFADRGKLETIRGNTAVPEAQTIPGAAAEGGQFDTPPTVGGSVEKFASPRTKRAERQQSQLPKLGQMPPAPELPDKPIKAEDIHPVPPSKEQVEAEKKAKEKEKEKEKKDEKPEATKEGDQAATPDAEAEKPAPAADKKAAEETKPPEQPADSENAAPEIPTGQALSNFSNAQRRATRTASNAGRWSQP